MARHVVREIKTKGERQPFYDLQWYFTWKLPGAYLGPEVHASIDFARKYPKGVLIWFELGALVSTLGVCITDAFTRGHKSMRV